MQSLLSSFLLLLANQYTTQADYGHSQQLLANVVVTESNQTQYLYLKAATAFALNDKKTVTEAIEQFELVRNSNTPVRYQALLFAMASNLESGLWSNPIADIERDMRISGDRLQNAYSGNTTQKVQQQIVAKLDKLIKDEEDRRNKAAKVSVNSNGEQQDVVPMPDSMPISGTAGESKVTEQQLKQLGEQWGSMPPQRRAKVLADITRDLPAKYKVQIEEYAKSLNRISK